MANKNVRVINTVKASALLNKEFILNLENKDELLISVRNNIRKKQKNKVEVKNTSSSYRFNL